MSTMHRVACDRRPGTRLTSCAASNKKCGRYWGMRLTSSHSYLLSSSSFSLLLSSSSFSLLLSSSSPLLLLLFFSSSSLRADSTATDHCCWREVGQERRERSVVVPREDVKLRALPALCEDGGPGGGDLPQVLHSAPQGGDPGDCE